MSWMRVDQALPSHRKVWHLERLLKIPSAQIVGHLVCMWLWALDSAEEGSVATENAWALEQAAGWTGEEGVFAAALTVAGFLEENGATLRFHDWEDHAGKTLESRREAAQRKRKQRAREREEKEETPSRSGHGDVTRTSSSTDRETDGQDEQREETDETDTWSGAQSSCDEGEWVGDHLSQAVEVLCRLSDYPLGAIETRQLLSEMAMLRPDIDLLREVNAWRSHILENGPPNKSWRGALRAWIENAHGTRQTPRAVEDRDPAEQLFANLAEAMSMDAALNRRSTDSDEKEEW